jgi:heme oxygenase
LESELSSERAALDDARKALAEQEAVRNGDERNYQKVLDRLQPFKDDVERRTRNVEALNKEISGLR